MIAPGATSTWSHSFPKSTVLCHTSRWYARPYPYHHGIATYILNGPGFAQQKCEDFRVWAMVRPLAAGLLFGDVWAWILCGFHGFDGDIKRDIHGILFICVVLFCFKWDVQPTWYDIWRCLKITLYPQFLRVLIGNTMINQGIYGYTFQVKELFRKAWELEATGPWGQSIGTGVMSSLD